MPMLQPDFDPDLKPSPSTDAATSRSAKSATAGERATLIAEKVDAQAGGVVEVVGFGSRAAVW